MSEPTWGYASQVGEWVGTLHIPTPWRRPPAAAIDWLLRQVLPILSGLHRPRQMLVSWAEYDDQGREVGFHELDEMEVTSWDAIRSNLGRLAAGAHGTFVLSCLFITMDTAVIDDDASASWAESSAELQVSIPDPDLAPEMAGLRYTTFIDVWLSTTYGERYAARPNHAAAARNRPRLQALLRAFSALVGESYAVGQSQLYYDAITATGFRDLDTLPTRSST